MQQEGRTFVSETDTEIVAQLFDYYYNGDLVATMIKVIEKIRGAYALGVLCSEHPDEIVAVRKDSPLLVGLGKMKIILLLIFQHFFGIYKTILFTGR